MWRSHAPLLACALTIGLGFGWAVGRPAAQSNPLPPGRNVEIVTGRCVICHSLEVVAQQRQDRAGWEAIVDRMISYGAPIPPEDKALFIESLVSHLGA
jgi:hypothetical protein